MHEITKGQLYYYRKKFKKQDHINFHAISMNEEKSKTQINLVSSKFTDIRIEVRAINIYIPGEADAIKNKMLKSPSAKMWGTLSDGTNQGVKHFADYWDKYPERIPSLAKRLGIDESMFDNIVQGFENFTEQALRVKKE